MKDESVQLVETCLDLGALLLTSGGEVTRVEDTITRILAAYGMKRIGVFTITSLIQVTAFSPQGEQIVELRRIAGGYATDLDQVERLNALSRQICETTPPLAQVQEQLEAIRAPRPEPWWKRYLGAVLVTVGFMLFFGGTAADIPATVALAGLITLLEQKGLYKKENHLLFYLLCSVITGVAGCLLVYLGVGVHLDKILISGIMLTIPGIAITYAVRDMLLGEIITGLLRFVESLLITASIAGGFLLATVMMGGILQ